MAANTKTTKTIASSNATLQTALTDVDAALAAIPTYNSSEVAIVNSGVSMAGTAAAPIYVAFYTVQYYSAS